MKIQPTLLILFTLLISSVFSILKLRSDAFAKQDSSPSAALLTPAGSKAPQTVSSTRDPQAILRDAHLKLVSQPSIRARLLQSFHNGEQRVLGRGEYLQGDAMRIKYTLELDQQDGRTARLIQVCDSNILWTHQELHPMPSDIKPEDLGQYIRVTRRNVKRILDEFSDEGQYFHAELALGGPAALLTALDTHMTFESASEHSYNETPCYVLTGRWNDPQSQSWNALKASHREYMASYRPSAVEVWIDQQTLFPVQIRYLRTQSKKLYPLFTLAFEDIHLGESISPAEFLYTPPTSITPTDTTREFLDKLAR